MEGELALVFLDVGREKFLNQILWGGDERIVCGVANCLEFQCFFAPCHIVCIALQLNDDEIALIVDSEQVNTPLGVVPVSELFGDNQHARRYRVYVVS